MPEGKQNLKKSEGGISKDEIKEELVKMEIQIKELMQMEIKVKALKDLLEKM